MARAAHNRAASTMFNETEFAQFALPFFVKALSTEKNALTEDQIKEKSMTDEGRAELQKLFGEVKKTAKSSGYKEAEGKYQKTLNKLAKDTLGVEVGDADSPEMVVEAIKDGYKPQSGDAPDLPALTEKAVKQHPLYLTMENAKTDADKALADRNAEFDRAIDERVNGKVTALTLQQQALNMLPEIGAKMPTHVGQKESLLSQYKKSWEDVIPKENEGKTYYYDGEGNRLEDSMGTPKTLEMLSRERAERYFELEGPNRDSPAAKPQGGAAAPAGGGSRASLTPKTMDELNKVLEDKSVKPEDQKAAKDYYRSNGTDLN